MKKLLILIFVAALYFNAISQKTTTSNYQDNWQYYYGMYSSYSYGVSGLINYGHGNKTNDIKSETRTSYKYKKGKKSDTPFTETKYNYTNGKLSNYSYSKNGKEKYEYQYTYNNDGYYTNYKQYKKGEFFREENIIYNDSNKIVKYKSSKKGEPISNYVCEYQDGTRILKKDNYKKEDTEPNYSWIYTYYEDGKIKSTEHYTKGKLKSLYLYTCNDEGKKVKDTIKTSKVCSIKEYNDDGSYVVVHRTTNSKGKIRKTRYTYNKEKKLIAYESITPKGVIKYKYTNTYNENGKRIEYLYYRNGGEKVKYRETFKYNSDNKVVEKVYYKGHDKMYSKNVTLWSKNDKVAETKSYNRKNELVKKIQYKYDERNNMIQRIVYKKESISKEYNYVYDYI